MNIIFLGGFFPKQFEDSIFKRSKLQIQNAANTFQWAFIKGLEENLNHPIKLITAPFIGWYPKYYKDFIFKTSFFSNKNELNSGIMVGFCNLPIIKGISKYINLSHQINKLISTEEHTVIIVYSIDIAYMKAALKAKYENKNLKVCVIITDLHEFSGDASLIYKWYIKYYQKPLFYKLISKIDGFVVLTDKMINYLDIGHKPSVRVEGLYENRTDADASLFTNNKQSSELKTILYTGTLDYKYGIRELLDAFGLIKSNEYRLWICGGGSGISLVKQRGATDKRIIYYGILPKQEISKLQSQATILVNPRNTIGEYNKYSFPSKTMEYLASGTPTLLYKLDGIPEEYFNYCYTINDNSIETFANAIINVCELNPSVLKSKGEKAREFILTKKTSSIQCEKVVNMLFKLFPESKFEKVKN